MDKPKYGTPEWEAYIAEERKRLEAEVGQVWDTSEVQADFAIEGFMAPLVSVTRRVDQVKGSMFFQHSPRFYYRFTPNYEIGM